jgi:hypothetical protein
MDAAWDTSRNAAARACAMRAARDAARYVARAAARDEFAAIVHDAFEDWIEQ